MLLIWWSVSGSIWPLFWAELYRLGTYVLCTYLIDYQICNLKRVNSGTWLNYLLWIFNDHIFTYVIGYTYVRSNYGALVLYSTHFVNYVNQLLDQAHTWPGGDIVVTASPTPWQLSSPHCRSLQHNEWFTQYYKGWLASWRQGRWEGELAWRFQRRQPSGKLTPRLSGTRNSAGHRCWLNTWY